MDQLFNFLESIAIIFYRFYRVRSRPGQVVFGLDLDCRDVAVLANDLTNVNFYQTPHFPRYHGVPRQSANINSDPSRLQRF